LQFADERDSCEVEPAALSDLQDEQRHKIISRLVNLGMSLRRKVARLKSRLTPI
jgi:hypothetical protein